MGGCHSGVFGKFGNVKQKYASGYRSTNNALLHALINAFMRFLIDYITYSTIVYLIKRCACFRKVFLKQSKVLIFNVSSIIFSTFLLLSLCLPLYFSSYLSFNLIN